MRPGLTDNLQEIEDALKTAAIDLRVAQTKRGHSSLARDTTTWQWILKGGTLHHLLARGKCRWIQRAWYWFCHKEHFAKDDRTPQQTAQRESLGCVNIICGYAPTLQATAKTKDQLYEALDATLPSFHCQNMSTFCMTSMQGWAQIERHGLASWVTRNSAASEI